MVESNYNSRQAPPPVPAKYRVELLTENTPARPAVPQNSRPITQGGFSPLGFSPKSETLAGPLRPLITLNGRDVQFVVSFATYVRGKATIVQFNVKPTQQEIPLLIGCPRKLLLRTNPTKVEFIRKALFSDCLPPSFGEGFSTKEGDS